MLSLSGNGFTVPWPDGEARVRNISCNKFIREWSPERNAFGKYFNRAPVVARARPKGVPGVHDGTVVGAEDLTSPLGLPVVCEQQQFS